METKRYPLTEEIDGVNGYVEISKGRQKFVMKDGKKVAHSAFMLSGMDEIFFPDSLEKIGNMAFMHCRKLKTIHFGRNIKTIGDMAFLGCKQLNSIVLPESVETIGVFSFPYVDEMTVHHMPEGLMRAFVSHADEIRRGSAYTVKLNVGTDSILIPKNTVTCMTASYMQQLAERYLNNEEQKRLLFQHAVNKKYRVMCAAEMYAAYTKNEGAKEFLKENGKDAILYLSENVPLLVRLLRDDVFGRDAVAEAFDVVQSENGNTMMKAYLLQSLHDGDAEKDVQNIQLSI